MKIHGKDSLMCFLTFAAFFLIQPKQSENDSKTSMGMKENKKTLEGNAILNRNQGISFYTFSKEWGEV